MGTEELDVVVVGAGIGGTTAALLLAGAGASVTLLERVPKPAAVGAGLLLQPNGLAVLDGLGLGADVRQASRLLHKPLLRSSKGDVLAGLTPPAFGPGLDQLLAVRRSRLQDLLLDAVASQSRIELRLNAEVTKCRDDGTVELRWHDRLSTITTDLVVGADGVHSTIRNSGGFGTVKRSGGRTYLRGLVDGFTDLEGEYWTALGLFGGAPVDDTTTYFYADATAHPVAEALAAHDIASLRRAWHSALPLAGRLFDQVPGTSSLMVNDVTTIRCERWVNGRLVLLGDAAHAMAPTVGQGANSAMVDAAALTVELASPDTSLASALQRYAHRRRGPVHAVQRRATRLAQLAELRSPLLRTGRDRALATLGRIPGVAAYAARGLQQEDPAQLRRSVAELVAGAKQ